MAANSHDSSHASRKFYELPDNVSFQDNGIISKPNSEELFSYIDKETIGSNATFLGPYGWRNVVYCDNTASSRSLSFIENYIQDEVLPYYGNTHTTTTVSSMQTTLYRHESRDIIRRVVNASEEDVVIFTGTGCTGAVNTLAHALNVENGGIAFIGPFEHHSNILPWKESGFDIIWIKTTYEGVVDINDLEQKLSQNKSRGLPMIGCFSAASNITGILTDVNEVSVCLHKHGALAFFDYATAGPYVELNMNPLSTGKCYKDAMFISPHKFPGGPGTPGILVAKKTLFQRTAPSNTGGGGVFYVTHNTHRYLKDIETREESGTPDIIGSIRAGMVFQLRESIDTDTITQRDDYLVSCIKSCMNSVEDRLIILGESNAKQLPIISFVVKHVESGRLLHYNFVSVLLNDLFGIQARGGCACSGPYAQQLLGMTESLALKYESLLLEDDRLDRHHLRRSNEGSTRETLRPGFTRVGLTYFSTNEFVEFVLAAIKLVAEFGWKLLPLYSFNAETGEWKYRGFRKFKDRKWLGSITYSKGSMQYRSPNQASTQENSSAPNFHQVLEEARKLLSSQTNQKAGQVATTDTVMFDTETEKYRWFLLPSEAQEYMCNIKSTTSSNFILPFHPGKFDKQPSSSNTNYGFKSDKMLEMSANLDTTKSESVSNPIHKIKFLSPPKNVMTPLITAIDEFKMIQDGDRVLLCLSGGKDSLSMLHAICQYKHVALAKGIKFTFGAMTVDPQSLSYDPSPLKHYLAALNVPYFYEEQNIIKQAAELPVCESICSFCSRMKRGRIYACARREGYNVVALGQHLDDIAESFMMSVFHNGFLRTMKANYFVREGDLRVIRPLIYAREQNLRKFAENSHLPIIAENCPACFEEPKERHRVKQLLAQQEILYPNLYKSFSTALHPLFSKNRTGLEKVKVNIINKDDLDEDD